MDKIINRLKTLQGHLGGIINMMEKEKPCEDILIQMKAVSSSFSNIQGLIFQNYLDQCIELEDENKKKVQEALKLILK